MEPKTVRRAASISSTRQDDSNTHNALTAGTIVLTMDGALPVEFLNAGDRVITRDAGMAVLRDVKRFRVTTNAIAIKAGSLGNNRPDADTVLPAAQEVLVRDWRAEALFGKAQALVPASRLVDGEFIRDLGEVEIECVELIFDAPHIVYAGGLELASTQEEALLLAA